MKVSISVTPYCKTNSHGIIIDTNRASMLLEPETKQEARELNEIMKKLQNNYRLFLEFELETSKTATYRTFKYIDFKGPKASLIDYHKPDMLWNPDDCIGHYTRPK